MAKVADKPLTIDEIMDRLAKMPDAAAGSELLRLSGLFEQARNGRDWESLAKIGGAINAIREKLGKEAINIPTEPPPKQRPVARS